MDSNGPRPFDFMPGYPNNKPQQYMNLGYVSSPYPGKTGEGDYGPLQGGEIYYRPGNSAYPYLMDFDPRATRSTPTLAYAQDIPKFNREVDLSLIRSGFFGKNTARELNMYQNKNPRSMSTERFP